jgi:tetratricopeptide (TPR) repeat protein
MKIRTLFLAAISTLVLVLTQFNASAADHPYYLHALSDLRAARWLIDHRPGDWRETDDEIAVVGRIDEAIREIKKASIDDGKDLADHPRVDERADHIGRLHEAVDYLEKARHDIDQDEDNIFADGLRDRARKHIDEAIRRTRMVINLVHAG